MAGILNSPNLLLQNYTPKIQNQNFNNDHSSSSSSANNDNLIDHNYTTTTLPNTTRQSYANTVKQTTMSPLNKEQGIILTPGYPEIQLEEYLLTLCEKIEPDKIIFASRISNNRINVFLKDKESVDKLLQNNKTMQIQGKKIEIRRYSTPSKRILISNCSPIIPNQIIEDYFKQIGLKPVSPITFLKIGSKHSILKNIYSFRRQVYVVDDENAQVPESLEIRIEDTPFKIFFSDENTKCNICKRNGHPDTLCHQNVQNQNKPIERNNMFLQSTQTNNQSQNTQQTQEPDLITKSTQLLHTQISNETELHTTPTKNGNTNQISVQNNQIQEYVEITSEETSTKELQELNQQIIELQKRSDYLKRKNKLEPINNRTSTDDTDYQEQISQENLTPTATSTPSKRAATELNSPGAEEKNFETTTTDETPSQKYQVKKPKTNGTNNTNDELDLLLMPIKEEIEKNSEKYTLNYNQLKHFVDNFPSAKDKHQFASEYAKDWKDIYNMLRELYKSLTDSKMKNRFTRIMKKLNSKNNIQDDDIIVEY